MITKDVLLPPRQDLLLSLTDPNISHPLHQTLQMRAATVSQLRKGARFTFGILGTQNTNQL